MNFQLDHDFQKLDSDRVFYLALVAEGQRLLRHTTSLWAPRRADGLFPLDEEAFFMTLEVPCRFEPLSSLGRGFCYLEYTRLQSFFDWHRGVTETPPQAELITELMRPEIARWLLTLKRETDPTKRLGGHPFLQFVEAMNRHENGQLPFLPKFQATHVRPWRSFVDMYPNSVKMLDRIVRRSESEEIITFAAALLPVIALSTNKVSSDFAHEALRRLSSREQDFRSYRFRREIYRGPAEAGDGDQLKKVLALLSRRDSKEDEIAYLKSYGWTEDVLREYIETKLNFPTTRDENLRPLYERMREVTCPHRG